MGGGRWAESWRVKAEKASRETVGSNGWGGSLECGCWEGREGTERFECIRPKAVDNKHLQADKNK